MLTTIQRPRTPEFEGVFASNNPRIPLCAGAGALVCATGDLAVSRFGWADLAAGTVANTRTNAAQRLGWVFPQVGTWQRIYFDKVAKAWKLRAGLPVTVFVQGDFWVRFPGGAVVGNPVYALSVDGTPVSGYTAAGELTPWTVVAGCAPGELAIISTWSKFT